MSQMMLDEEELKAKQMEKVGNDLSRPSIGGNNDQVWLKFTTKSGSTRSN